MIMGAAFAIGSLSLNACSEGADDPTSGPATPSSSSAVIPDTLIRDPSIKFTGFGPTGGGQQVNFAGTVALEFDSTSLETVELLKFTSITFSVTNPNGEAVPVMVNYAPPAFPTNNTLNFSEMKVNISYTDPAFGANCGSFNLYAAVTAGDGTNEYANNQATVFERPEAFCRAMQSSSSEAPVKVEIKMTNYIAEMSTDFAPALKIATGVVSTDVDTADIVLTKSGNGDVNITSPTGLMFAPIRNGDLYENEYQAADGFWPEEFNATEHGDPTVYLSQFKYKFIDQSSINDIIVNENVIFIVKAPNADETTGVGYYALGLKAKAEKSNKEFNITLKIYKPE